MYNKMVLMVKSKGYEYPNIPYPNWMSPKYIPPDNDISDNTFELQSDNIEELSDK